MAQPYRFRLVASALAVSLPLVAPAMEEQPVPAAEFRECAALSSPDARLTCFDELAARTGVPKAASQNAGLKEPDPLPSRVMSRWDTGDLGEQGRFALVVHKPNYVLAGSWNFNPNQEPFNAGALRVRNEEVKLQLSFKVKLLEDLIGGNGDVWATYSQQSYWLAYAKSSPFRDTTYEPSLMFVWRTDANLLGLRARMLGLEINHQSNGRGDFGALSRSWNRVMGRVAFERDDFVAELRGWLRIPEPSSSDNNPDIERYLGNSELMLTFHRGRHVYSAQLRSNLKPDDHHGAAELSWAFPLPGTENLKGYLQYFHGYGESLIDYNASTNRIGIGVSFSDWY